MHYLLKLIMHRSIIMLMNKTITITSKGQTTLPAAIRHKMGIDNAGGILQISFNEQRGELVITKPVGLAELSEKISRHIKPGTKPVKDVDAYYQQNREAK